MQNKYNEIKYKKNCYKNIQKPSQRNVLFFWVVFNLEMEIYFILWKSLPIIKGNYISGKTNTFNSHSF